MDHIPVSTAFLCDLTFLFSGLLWNMINSAWRPLYWVDCTLGMWLWENLVNFTHNALSQENFLWLTRRQCIFLPGPEGFSLRSPTQGPIYISKTVTQSVAQVKWNTPIRPWNLTKIPSLLSHERNTWGGEYSWGWTVKEQRRAAEQGDIDTVTAPWHVLLQCLHHALVNSPSQEVLM